MEVYMKIGQQDSSRGESSTESSVTLVGDFVAGNLAAADRIYYRHRESILRLAREGMSAPLLQRIDPEDVYQSVSVILFEGLRKGRFQIQHAGDLRALVSRLTRQRILKKAELHGAEKRATSRECSLSPDEQLRCVEPLPSELTEQREVIETLLNSLSNPRHRQVIRMAMDGFEVHEVADRCGYSQARVRQILETLAARVQRDEICHDC